MLSKLLHRGLVERPTKLDSSGIASDLPLDVIHRQHLQGFGHIPTDPMDEKRGNDLLDGVSLAHAMNPRRRLGLPAFYFCQPRRSGRWMSANIACQRHGDSLPRAAVTSPAVDVTASLRQREAPGADTSPGIPILEYQARRILGRARGGGGRLGSERNPKQCRVLRAIVV